jgi:hypothetical protein
MSKSRVVPLRIPEHLDELAAFCAKIEHTDKATALRQWLFKGAELWIVRQVSDGRISASRGAELLDLSIFDIYAIAELHGIELGATLAQSRRSRELVEQLAGEVLKAKG